MLARSREVGLVLDAVDPWPELRRAITGVALGLRTVALTYQRGRLIEAACPDSLKAGQLTVDGERAVLTVPALSKQAGGSRVLSAPAGADPVLRVERDPVLVRALARAEAWRRRLVRGEVATLAQVAEQEELALNYVQRILRLAFLAPDLKLAILDGRQPAGLTLERLRRGDLPLDWAAQRGLFGAR